MASGGMYEGEEAAKGDGVRVGFVTAGGKEEARKIASALVDERLVACVNIIPGVESVYEWEGKVEMGEEVLMMLKTTKEKEEELTTRIRALHSYDEPEVIFASIQGGSGSYLDWVRTQTRLPKIERSE